MQISLISQPKNKKDDKEAVKWRSNMGNVTLKKPQKNLYNSISREGHDELPSEAIELPLLQLFKSPIW